METTDVLLTIERGGVRIVLRNDSFDLSGRLDALADIEKVIRALRAVLGDK